MALVTTAERPLKKGERTRRQIKKAVLEVMADAGVNAVTHRSVASQAGVSLSATTYHFSSLDDMLFQSFDLIENDSDDMLDSSLSAAARSLEDLGLTPDASAVVRKRVRDKLVQIAVEYLGEPSRERRVRQAAEMRFIYETGHIKPLKERIAAYREGVIERLKALPENAGSPCPELDAGILYDAIQSIQLASISQPEGLPRDIIEQRIKRLIGWVIGCS